MLFIDPREAFGDSEAVGECGEARAGQVRDGEGWGMDVRFEVWGGMGCYAKLWGGTGRRDWEAR